MRVADYDPAGKPKYNRAMDDSSLDAEAGPR